MDKQDSSSASLSSSSAPTFCPHCGSAGRIQLGNGQRTVSEWFYNCGSRQSTEAFSDFERSVECYRYEISSLKAKLKAAADVLELLQEEILPKLRSEKAELLAEITRLKGQLNHPQGTAP